MNSSALYFIFTVNKCAEALMRCEQLNVDKDLLGLWLEDLDKFSDF